MQRGVVVVSVSCVRSLDEGFHLLRTFLNISLHFFEQLVFERHNDTVFHMCNDSKEHEEVCLVDTKVQDSSLYKNTSLLNCC